MLQISVCTLAACLSLLGKILLSPCMWPRVPWRMSFMIFIRVQISVQRTVPTTCVLTVDTRKGIRNVLEIQIISTAWTGLTLNGACTSATYSGRGRGGRRSLTKCSVSLFGRLPGSWPWRFRRPGSRGIGDRRFWKSAQVCWLESRPKGLLFCGIWTMRLHRHLQRGWSETMIGVMRTGIAVAIGVRMIPTTKDFLTILKFPKQQGKFGWFGLLREL